MTTTTQEVDLTQVEPLEAALARLPRYTHEGETYPTLVRVDRHDRSPLLISEHGFEVTSWGEAELGLFYTEGMTLAHLKQSRCAWGDYHTVIDRARTWDETLRKVEHDGRTIAYYPNTSPDHQSHLLRIHRNQGGAFTIDAVNADQIGVPLWLEGFTASWVDAPRPQVSNFYDLPLYHFTEGCPARGVTRVLRDANPGRAQSHLAIIRADGRGGMWQPTENPRLQWEGFPEWANSSDYQCRWVSEHEIETIEARDQRLSATAYAALPRYEAADGDTTVNRSLGDGEMRLLLRPEHGGPTGYLGVLLVPGLDAGSNALRRTSDHSWLPEWLDGKRGLWVREGQVTEVLTADQDEQQAYLDSLEAREVTINSESIICPFCPASALEQVPYGYAGLAFLESEAGFEVTSSAVRRHGLDPRVAGTQAYWVPLDAVEKTYAEYVAALPIHRETGYGYGGDRSLPEAGLPFFARPEGFEYPEESYTGVFISPDGDWTCTLADRQRYGWLPEWMDGQRFFWAQGTEAVVPDTVETRLQAWYEALPTAEITGHGGAGDGVYRIGPSTSGSTVISLRLASEETGGMWVVGGTGHPDIPEEFHPHLRGWWVPSHVLALTPIEDQAREWYLSLPIATNNQTWCEGPPETSDDTLGFRWLQGTGDRGLIVRWNGDGDLGEMWNSWTTPERRGVPNEEFCQFIAGWWVANEEMTLVSEEVRELGLSVGDWFSWGTRAFWYHVASIDERQITTDTYWSAGQLESSNGQVYMVERMLGEANFTFGAPDSEVLPVGLRALPESEEVVTLREQVASLEARVASLDTDLATIRGHYSSDLDTIGRIMSDEADSRDWCDEYESVMQRINRDIHGNIETYHREVDYLVTITGDLSGTWSRQITVTAPRGADDDAIAEAVENYLESHNNYAHNIETEIEHPGDSRDDWEISDYDEE